MGTLKIVVRKEALSFIEKTTEWYDHTMGRKAALHFVTGIYETINRLAKFPGIGTLDERRSTDKIKYYSFLSHPNIEFFTALPKEHYISLLSDLQ